MRNRFLRLALLVMALTMLTGCESIPMPTGASMPTEDEIWGSGDDSSEQSDAEGEAKAEEEEASAAE